MWERQDYENALVGILITYPDKFHMCSVRSIQLQSQFNKLLLDRMYEKYGESQKWDMLALYDGTEEKGFATHLSKLIESPGVWPVIPEYCKRIKEFSEKTIVTSVIGEVGDEDPNQVQEMINSRLIANQDHEAEEIKDILPRVLATIGGDVGVSSGIKHFDEMTGGLKASRLYVLAARPSMGKSSLATNIALNVARGGDRVYIQSLEESKDAIVRRLLKNSENIDCLPIEIDDGGALDIEEIVLRVKRAHYRGKLDLIVVDHLQEIRSKGDTRHMQISNSCSQLKALAKELGVPVILLCQLSRAVENEAKKIPRMSHLKESGDIEAIADVVMLLYREHYYNSDADPFAADLFIAKNREGKTGMVKLRWNPEYLLFTGLVC